MLLLTTHLCVNCLPNYRFNINYQHSIWERLPPSVSMILLRWFWQLNMNYVTLLTIEYTRINEHSEGFFYHGSF